MNAPRLASVFLVTCCLHGAAAAQQRARVGYAFDADSGALLYQEQHLETVTDGEVVTDRVSYVDPQGRTFATKRVDFHKHPFMPEFSLDNTASGQVEALHHGDASSVMVRCREQANAAFRDAHLSAPEGALADAGFDRFIESEWDALLAGERPVRHFLVPCRLEFMGFRFRRIDDGGDAGQVSFAMEINSPLLRLLAPKVTVVYDRTSRRLLRYEGLSNIRDANGDNHRIRVEFQYPDSAQTSAAQSATSTLRKLRGAIRTWIRSIGAGEYT